MRPEHFLVLVITLGGGTVALVLGHRHTDQRRRDRDRTVVAVRFPRSLTDKQVEAFAQVLVGLTAPRLGLFGRDTAVSELIGAFDTLTHRLRLPGHAATFFVGQLRAAVPGVVISPIDEADAALTITLATELRLTSTAGPLSVADAAAVSAAILAACTGLRRHEHLVWQLQITGGTHRPHPASGQTWWAALRQAVTGGPEASKPGKNHVAHAVLRLGVQASTPERAHLLLNRLQRTASAVSTHEARLLPRRLPATWLTRRLTEATTPLVEAPSLLDRSELVALLGWPIGGRPTPGLVLGGSPQLPASPLVPTGPRVLGEATAGRSRPVGQSLNGALEHSLYLAPTGAGKTWLAAQVALGDIAAGSGVLVIDPKGSLVQAILDRLPEAAIDRTVVIDPTDEARPVPVALLAPERGGAPELPADTLVGLLQHRYRDLGPRSTDILTSSLYGLARTSEPSIYDLLRLWSNVPFRAQVAAASKSDPALASWFAWFNGLSATERNFILAAPMNKIRPLLQRSMVRNVLAAPMSTVTLGDALARRLVVLVTLPEGVLGADAAALIGQVILARLWIAVQGRARLAERSRRPFFVTVDEAPRFVDQPTDLGDVLARSREYGVGMTLIGQSLSQFPTALREIALNSARTTVAFQSSAADAKRLAAEFGPTVTPDMLTGLERFEAIGTVSLGGARSEPFTFRTVPLGEVIPGRAKAARAASREQWGVPREEIEARFQTPKDAAPSKPGPVGRRPKS